MPDHPILKDVPENLIAALKRRGWDLAQILLDAQQTRERYDHGRRKFRHDQTVTDAMRVPARFVTDLVDVLADMAREITRNESERNEALEQRKKIREFGDAIREQAKEHGFTAEPEQLPTIEWDKPAELSYPGEYEDLLKQLETHGIPIPTRVKALLVSEDKPADKHVTVLSAGDPVYLDDGGKFRRVGIVANLTEELARACLQKDRVGHSMGALVGVAECAVPGCAGGKDGNSMCEHVLGLHENDEAKTRRLKALASEQLARMPIQGCASDTVPAMGEAARGALLKAAAPRGCTWDDIYAQAEEHNRLLDLGEEPHRMQIPLSLVITPGMQKAIEAAGRIEEPDDGEKYGAMDTVLPVPIVLEHAMFKPLSLLNEMTVCTTDECDPAIVYKAEHKRFEMRGGTIEVIAAHGTLDLKRAAGYLACADGDQPQRAPFRLRIKGAAFEGKPLTALVRFTEQPKLVKLRQDCDATGLRLRFRVVDPREQPLVIRIFDSENPRLANTIAAKSVSKAASGRVHVEVEANKAVRLLERLEEKKAYRIYMPRLDSPDIMLVCVGLYKGATPRGGMMDLSFVPVTLDLNSRAFSGTASGPRLPHIKMSASVSKGFWTDGFKEPPIDGCVTDPAYVPEDLRGVQPHEYLHLNQNVLRVKRTDIPDSVPRSLVSSGPAARGRRAGEHHIRLGRGTIQVWATEAECMKVSEVLHGAHVTEGTDVFWCRIPKSYGHEKYGPLDVEFGARIVDVSGNADPMLALVRITLELV